MCGPALSWNCVEVWPADKVWFPTNEPSTKKLIELVPVQVKASTLKLTVPYCGAVLSPPQALTATAAPQEKKESLHW